MGENKIFVDWIKGGHLCLSDDDYDEVTIIRYNNFIIIHDEFSHYNYKELNKHIVKKVLPKVDFNKIYDGEYIYEIVIDNLLNCNKKNKIINKILKHLKENVDSKNFLPILIGEYKNIEDFKNNSHKIKNSGQIFKYYLDKYDDFINKLLVYIPDYKQITPEKKNNIINQTIYKKDDFLKYLKYSIEKI